jgi:hypothetical protein
VSRNGAAPAPGHSGVSGRIAAVHYQGSQTRVAIEAGEQRLTAHVSSSLGLFSEGETVSFHWPHAALHAMEQEQ